MKAVKNIPEATASDVAAVLSKHGVKLFTERSGLPLNQAQRNLEGRTHYVDDSTMKSFAAHIHTVHVMDDGLVLAIVESVQKGFNKEDGRVFRPVFFDVFGNTIYRPDIEDSFKTSKQAMSDLWTQADDIDAVKATINGAKQKHKDLQREADEFGALVEELE